MNNIGLAGYGTVGKGVASLLDGDKDARLVAIFDRSEKAAEIGGRFVGDFHRLTQCPEIDTVMECLGGDALPYALIVDALSHGKNVISSNKETISHHLAEYLALGKTHYAKLFFEASCGGGIPLLEPLSTIASFDHARSLQGILNGTTNFILTRLADGGSYEEALAEAQAKGFAERDPSADVDGIDLARKGSILAAILYGASIDERAIPRYGIRNFPKAIVSYFQAKNESLHFVMEIHPCQNGLSLLAIPMAFPAGSFLGGVKEETNGVAVVFEHNGPLFFAGKGAGQFPTASAMMQDLKRLGAPAALPSLKELKELPLLPDYRGDFIGFDSQGNATRLRDPSLASVTRFAYLVKGGETL